MADIYQKIAFINDVYDAYRKGKQIRLQAPSAANINTVASIAPEVVKVSEISDKIIDVSNSSTNINAVANDLTNINVVAGDLTNIDAVAGNVTNINAVNSNTTNINAVAGDLTNINAVAADLTNIDSASTYATNANIWAEGTDEQVQALGGVHSSKGWADISSQAQVQANWNEADTNSKAYIQNKPTIPTVTSTYSASGTDAVNGTAVASALGSYQLIAQPVSWYASAIGSLSVPDNRIFGIRVSGNITFTLPTVTDNNVFHQSILLIDMPTVYTIDLGTSYFFNNTAPDLSQAGTYNLYYEYDNNALHWVVGCISKGAAS